ncbi:MAG: hypothetical protein COT74_08360 [Bdellovibrionales bacterium CG10_big_fil_rev_8_21_14_0_10_45_34]|nr:MAG: hypothetical protein COT74_08360 [Bdellovibrionales bacterium CG10_big_fil_rev_8_21_14_0_10_45_34]
MQAEPLTAQLQFQLEREFQPDRNFVKGGRSFYFFDLDDNVIFLATSIYLFHKKTGSEVAVTTQEYAAISKDVSERGPWKDYELRLDSEVGSFRRFRDLGFTKETFSESDVKNLNGLAEEHFIVDLAHAMGLPDFHWKGPSWNCFYHATFNARPVSLITARGHHPEVLKAGFREMVNRRHLHREPNYVDIFPVNHPSTRNMLGDPEKKWSVARLKQEAIYKSVETAIERFGNNPHHRFGMSDDSPENLELITESMRELKRRYPLMSFFVIDTHQERFIKREVFAGGSKKNSQVRPESSLQLDLALEPNRELCSIAASSSVET